MDQKILDVNLLECDSLWEINIELALHPLVCLFPNYQCVFNGKPIENIVSLSEFFSQKLPKDHSESIRIDLSPSSMSIQDSRRAVLSLVQLIKDPKIFLANQMYRFFETTGRKNLIEASLEGLEFDCEEISLDDAFTSDLKSAQQFLKIENGENGNILKLETKQSQSIREIQFLRQLVLPASQASSLEGFEEYFEVLVETIERKFLGFIFCKRGVYLSRKIEEREKGEEVSLKLLSFPRENKKRMSGFFPSMIPLLAKESVAFAQRFQEFVKIEVPASKDGGLDLLLNCSFDNARYQYKHWLSRGSTKSSDFLGEGK